MMRPNSIDVKSAAYYQQLQLQQQQQQQQYNRSNGGINYNNVNENIYMPRVLKNYDDHHENSSPRMYPDTNMASEQQPISPSRIQVGSPSRPSQPPPAPPPEGAGTPTRGSRGSSTQRESLPPPPPPPPTSESDLMFNGHFVHQNGSPHQRNYP